MLFPQSQEKIHLDSHGDIRARILGFVRDAAIWTVREDGPKMLGIEVEIEVFVTIQMNDAPE